MQFFIFYGMRELLALGIRLNNKHVQSTLKVPLGSKNS